MHSCPIHAGVSLRSTACLYSVSPSGFIGGTIADNHVKSSFVTHLTNVKNGGGKIALFEKTPQYIIVVFNFLLPLPLNYGPLIPKESHIRDFIHIRLFPCNLVMVLSVPGTQKNLRLSRDRRKPHRTYIEMKKLLLGSWFLLFCDANIATRIISSKLLRRKIRFWQEKFAK